MQDFIGQEITVGDTLAISPSRKGYLYAAVVEKVETYTRDCYNGQTKQVEPFTFAKLQVRRDSDHKLHWIDQWDGYSERVVIIARANPE